MNPGRQGAQDRIEPPSTLVDLFTPKLITVFREGYTRAHLRADVIAGLTVAIVALPLSMAIAVASGATPAQGLYTAIVGGFIVSLLGGSRFQIGGPAGAFIVLVAATVQAHGMDGLILATMLAGLMLAAMGLLQLGTYIKFIPYPVTVGFTAGIAVIIFASQISAMFGLSLDGPEPGRLVEKLPVLWHALPTVDALTVVFAVGAIAGLVAMKRFLPKWPGMLIAVVASAAAVAVFDAPVETIGTRFGGIPAALPAPSWPTFTLEMVIQVLPHAVGFALLGSIESLLSAVVADGMTGRRHRSNCELVGQGVANIGSGLVGGICVTGAIARTATNIRAGAHGPMAGMFHAVFLLLFVLVAAPLASYIPLACLAGVLAVVAWNMAERHAFATLLRASRGDAAVLLVTFLLTVFRDLTEAIVVGFALGAVIFIHRMSKTAAVEAHMPFVPDDAPDETGPERTPYDEMAATDRDVIVYRISGAFFFGAAASIGAVLDRISDSHRALVVDLEAVSFLDSTGANTVSGLVRKAAGRGVTVFISGASGEIRQELAAHGVGPPQVAFTATVDDAVSKAHRLVA